MKNVEILNIETIERIKLRKISPLRSYIARLFKGNNGDWFINKNNKQFSEYVNQVLREASKEIDDVILVIEKRKNESNSLKEKKTDRAQSKILLIEYEIKELELAIEQFYGLLEFLLVEKKTYLEKCLLIYCKDTELKKRSDEKEIKEIIERIKKVNNHEVVKIEKE